VELRQVQYFLSVAKTGSFSAAAEELYISQSSLSKQIIALEKELGFPLFDRSKRKIALTEPGGFFLEHALRLNETYLAMMAELEPYKVSTPTLSIVSIPVMAQYGITSYIAQFRKQVPHIHLYLDEREASAILPALNAHQFELGFIRDNYIDTDQYACLEIDKDRLSVVVSNKHRYAARKSITLVELSDENFILFDRGTIVHELSVDACRKAGFEPRVFYASLRVESILSLVASNSGVALMMEKIFDYYKHPDVVAIPLEEVIESKIVIASLKNRKLPRSANSFLEFMQKALASSQG
jgi:DNA-binding transcriptional LysR family regulator